MREHAKGTMRLGYTTGACAAAAAKAAALALLNQKTVKSVQISLPSGEKANFGVTRCVFNSFEASSSVIKDAGDDPDVTDGAEICATVSLTEEAGITVDRGKGVGLVTKPGLEVPVGMPAINRVPHSMIIQSVEAVMRSHTISKGLKVVISVPQGEALAKRTLNRRLGIVGGISILGTSGVVIPYSVQAYKVAISQALDVAVASGCRKVVLTTGRRSEKYAQKEFALSEEAFIQMVDFVGYTINECANKGLAKIIIWGMAGKLSKIAAGHLYTHVGSSRVEINFLADVARSCGVPDSAVAAMKKAVNAHHFLRLAEKSELTQICNLLCSLAAKVCREHVKRAVEVECVMTEYNGTILGRGYAEG